MKTTHEIGGQLEDLIVAYLEAIDPKARRSRASGASTESSDIVTSLPLRIEAKKRNTKNCIINMKWWKKLCGECLSFKGDIPMLVLQNEDNDTFCVFNINDAMRILQKYYAE